MEEKAHDNASDSRWQENPTEATLFLACELREKTWKLGFTTGPGQKPRERGVTARNQERVLDEIAQAKRRFGLPETAPCDQLLRSRARRVLAASVFAGARDHQSCGGFLRH